MTTDPLFSILLPVYNNKEDIINAITSVINQTYTNWELIIINDASSDETAETIVEFLAQINKDNIILLSNEKNAGTFISLNNGLMLAKGKYISRIDSDDTIDKKFIEEYTNIFNKNPTYRIAQAKYSRNGSHGIHGEITIVYEKSIIDEIGYYDSVRFGADTEFHMRIKKKYGDHKIIKLDKLLYHAKKRNGSLTTSPLTGLHGSGQTIRQKYVSQFNNWHNKGNLYMKYPLDERPFSVDDLMLP